VNPILSLAVASSSSYTDRHPDRCLYSDGPLTVAPEGSESFFLIVSDEIRYQNCYQNRSELILIARPRVRWGWNPFECKTTNRGTAPTPLWYTVVTENLQKRIFDIDVEYFFPSSVYLHFDIHDTIYIILYIICIANYIRLIISRGTYIVGGTLVERVCKMRWILNWTSTWCLGQVFYMASQSVRQSIGF
jgi:hypothetical protein